MAARSRLRPGWTEWPRPSGAAGASRWPCRAWRRRRRTCPISWCRSAISPSATCSGSEHQRRQYLATAAVPRCAGPLVGQRGCAALGRHRRAGAGRRGGQPGAAAGRDSGLRYSYNAATQSVNRWCRMRCARLTRSICAACPGAAGHQRTRAGAELRRLRADQRLVPVVAVHRTALFQSVRRVQQHRHQLSWRARQPCRWHWALHPLRHVLDAFRPDTMRTLRLGDTITSSLDWSRSIRIAGVQWGATSRCGRIW